VRIVLNFKNIDYEIRPVHLVKDEQNSDEYKLLNPKGEVPLLVLEDLALGQSMAIMMYLDRKWPNPPIFPSNPERRAECIQLCEVINSGIQPIQNLKVLKYIEGKIDKMEWGKYWIEEGLKAFENSLAKTASQYCLDDSLSAADMFLVPQVYNAMRFNVDMEQFPTIKKINENCLEHQAFKDALPENQPDAS